MNLNTASLEELYKVKSQLLEQALKLNQDLTTICKAIEARELSANVENNVENPA